MPQAAADILQKFAGWRGYALALVTTVVAVALRGALDDQFGDAYPFIFSFAAVAVTAALAGWKAALFCILASYVLIDWFFIPPREGFAFLQDRSGVMGLASFCFTSAILVLLAQVMRQAHRQSRAHSDLFRVERERLRITLGSIGDGVIATDAQGKVTYLNAVAEALTGWTNAEAQGRKLAEVFRIVNESTREPVDNPVKQVLATGKIVGLANHTVLIARSGAERAIADSAAPIQSEEKGIEGVVLVFRDVDQERKAERALFRQTERERVLTGSLAQLLAAGSREPMTGELWSTVAPAAGAEMVIHLRFDESSNTLAFHSASGLPAGAEASLSQLDAAQGICGSGAETRNERIFTRVQESNDGQNTLARSLGIQSCVSVPLWAGNRFLGTLAFASRSRPELEDEEVEFIRTFSQHIALALDRLQTEQQLREREQRLREQARLLDLTNDAMIVCSLDDRITYWNRAAQEIYGWTSEEALGQRKYELLKTELPEPRPAILAKLERDNRWEGELVHRTRDGTRIIVNTRWALHRDEQGRPAYVLKSDNDVTERVNARRVLEEQAKALQDAGRRKDEFLAMLAHELRNPLASVSGAVTLLQTSDAPDDRAWGLDVVERQVAQLTRLIDDLLDVSRITSGKVRLRKTQVDAREIVRRAAEAFSATLEERGHRLILESDERNGALYLEGDPARLEQIIGNLLTNAAKYTENGGTIWLGARQDGTEPQSPQILISVRDTGVGIPPERIPEMFELFAQGERSIARSEGGLGIGLTVVQRLAEMHGGTVTATSEGPGKGSEFTVRLPALARGAELPLSNGSERLEREDGASIKGCRVLVVDDNVDTANVIARLLKRAGHAAHLAYSGTEAIEVARTISPEVVLLDIGLPGADGYEVCRQLRAEPCCKGAKIIAISGYSQEEDRRRSKAAGFDHHLVKPVELQDLKALLADR